MTERSRQARKLRAVARPLEQAQPAGPEPALDFTAELQAAVRARVRDILAGLQRETTKQRLDGAQLDRLASALERLADLERVLDGRPLPGSRRPPREDAPSSRSAGPQRRGPVAPVPQPQPTLAPAPIESDDDEEPRNSPAPLD